VPIYEYKGLTTAGKTVKGIEDAESQGVLRSTLQAKGIFVTEVFEGKGAASSGDNRDINFKKMLEFVSLRDIALVTRQLATLLRAGIPLVESLTALSDQAEKDELKRVLSDVRRQVNEGSSLAAALGKHPKHFGELYVNMVKAGESAGNLDVVLIRLTEFLEAQTELRAKIVGAMIYPIIMSFVGLGIMVLLFTFVIPKITAIFKDQGAALPPLTRLLMFTSDLFANWWFVLFPAIFLAIWGFFRWKKSEEGRQKWDRFILKVPFVGNLVRMIAIARFSRTLGTLLTSGVPLLQALDIVKDILGNTRLVEVIEEARRNIREGESIAQPLKRSGEFPPLVTHMINIGEKSGQLEEMLENVAISYKQQVDVRIQALTTILEPIMIVFMGIGAAIVVFGIMLPILQLNQMLGG
jgi:general secretion pathway protein F